MKNDDDDDNDSQKILKKGTRLQTTSQLTENIEKTIHLSNKTFYGNAKCMTNFNAFNVDTPFQRHGILTHSFVEEKKNVKIYPIANIEISFVCC